MRIALVTREYPPDTAWGGIGRFYAVFAHALAESGHEVEVFKQGLSIDRSLRIDGVLVHEVVPRRFTVGRKTGGDLAGMEARHLGAFSFALAFEMALKVFGRHREKPFDLVEGHEHLGINAFINLFGGACFRRVTRYHTAYHSLTSRGLANWPRSATIRRLERLSLRAADVRISASEFIDQMTRQDFPGVGSCDAVIPLLPEASTSLEIPPVASREKLLLFVGRMMPGHKNPDMAARAFAELAGRFPEWRIEFAGADMQLDTGESAWEQCRKVLAPWEGRFHYHGPLEYADVQRLYRRARIALMPSKFESFGLVALESMSAGTTPVVADQTALPEVVGDCGVTFRNGSMPDLVAKLAELMADPERQARLGSRAVERVSEVFSRQMILRQNLELFAGPVGRSRG